MRTKTALLTVAAFAAGLAGASAQVYSQNIVGYVNTVLTGNNAFTLVANPLDNGNGNFATNLVDPSNLLPAKTKILTWNGSGFNNLQKGGGGWPANSLSVPPGVGFFVYLPATQVSNVTNTFVGNVLLASGSSVTNVVPVGLSLWGSPLPFAGDLTTDTNLNISPLLTVSKSQLLTWNGSGYNNAQKGGAGWNTNSVISVGQGFFVNSKVGNGSNWVQSLP